MEKLTDTELLNLRYHAHQLAEHVLVAYWQEPDKRAFHFQRCKDALEKIALLTVKGL